MIENEQASPATPEKLYLDLVKRVLSGYGAEAYKPLRFARLLNRLPNGSQLSQALAGSRFQIVRRLPPDSADRIEGKIWPTSAKTMIGLRRLDNIEHCICSVLNDSVPGDLIETGVWRGGASMFMRAVLKAYNVPDRVVWVADSFAGLPLPNEAVYPADAGDRHWQEPLLAVSLEEVKVNFAEYGLLDDQVRFLAGWFSDTLPVAPIDRLAVLRLDGDMYESTIVALRSLYPKLSPGGYVIVDDWGAVPACRRAINDFRSESGIDDPIDEIDWTGIYWRRSS